MTIHNNISEINENQWRRLIIRSQTASYFQTQECYEFYDSLSFMEPFIYGVSENDKLMGVMCGYIISAGSSLQRFFSRRAIVPGGLLLDPNITTEGLKSLLEKVKSDLSQKVIFIEIQNYKDYNEYRLIFESEKFNYEPFLNFYVPSYDVPTALGRLSDALQKQLKFAQNAGVEWQETNQKDDIKAFYSKLKQQHKKSPKTTLFPIEFFEKLVDTPNGKLFVAKYKRKVAGGMACVILQGSTMYEWFICDEIDVAQRREVHIGTTVNWSGIEYAAKNNIFRLEFMNVGKPTTDFRAHEFKRKYGGQSVELGRFLFINKPLLYFIGRFVMEKIIRR
ncbi:MAG: GNAT family N-acetyltransferase [Paludibacter sp.]|nr:GNAT family N-acetyltransferase [Paludibacter sp.]